MKKISLLLCLLLSLVLVGCTNNEVKEDIYEENVVEEYKNSSEVCYYNVTFDDNELLKVVRSIPASDEEQKACKFYFNSKFINNIKRFGETNSCSLIFIPRENSAYEIYETAMNENFELELKNVLAEKTTDPIIYDLPEYEFDTHIAVKVYDENDDVKTTWFVSESGMDGHLVMPNEEGIIVDLTAYDF